ncbi:MAG: cytochrome c biogenesis protein ResB [Candidatus Aminicenantes bacterium]|nr:cytochrome c biogenesis protein ResB [Candidatus Aminicenantes bacterium]
MLNDLKKHNIIKFSYSLKLTVACLIFLAILTTWGTIYQADNGLYAAKAKFFTSWFFLAGGFIPLPGAGLVLSVLFVNLISSMIFRIGLRLKNIGNILTHLGILILLLGGFFTFFFSEESVLMLKEGEKSSWSNSYHAWELSVWKDARGVRHFSSISLNDLGKDEKINFPDFPITIKVKKVFMNSSAFRDRERSSNNDILNSSGIVSIDEKETEPEPEANIPGLVLFSEDLRKDILLYGGENIPTSAEIKGDIYNFSLRKLRKKLPIELGLLDFRIKKYPGSEIVKSYESTVEIRHDDLKREVIISMNKPFRYKDYTFFQSRYQITPAGVEYSIFAVVKNSGRLLPYISSIAVFIGMLIHFIVMLFRRKKENSSLQKGN